MQILVPKATLRNTQKLEAQSLSALSGKRVGLVSNGWVSMDAMAPRLTHLLKEKHGVSEVNMFTVHVNKPIEREVLDQIASRCDAAIVGLAN